ncbi:MAG: ATP-binding protein [Candidatus Edwardsbacteria bacterium]|nr:ATP-binding protein [Candidatus Edwardsbacteria bacterium]
MLQRLWANFITSGFGPEKPRGFMRRVKFTNALSTFGLLFLFGIGIIRLFQGKVLLGSVDIGLGLVLVAALIILRLTGNVGLTSGFGTTGLFLLEMFLYSTGTAGQYSIVWFYFFPVVAFFLFGKRGGWVWIGLLFLSTLFLALLGQAGVINTPYTFPVTVYFLASLLLETMMVYYYASVMETEEGIIEERNQRLSQSNAALSNEIAQRQRAEEELLRISKAVRSSSDAMIVAGPDGTYIFSNKAFYDLFCYTLSDINRGGGYQALYQDRSIGQQVLDTIKSGGAWHGEVAMQTKTGRVIQVFLRADAIKGQDGSIMGLVANHTDISSRKEAEKLQSALYRISELTNSTGDLAELYRGIHEIVDGLMYAKNLLIAQYDSVSQTISFPYFVDQFDAPPPPRQLGNGLTDYVIKTGKPLLASQEDIETLSQAGDLKLLGTECLDWLGVPLQLRGQVLGVLAVQNYTEAARFSDNEKKILTFVSQHIAGAIERKRAQDQVRRSEENFQRVISSINDHIYMTEFDKDGKPVNAYISPNVAGLTGYPLENFRTDWSFWPGTVIHPDDRAPAAAQVERFLAGHDSEVEYRLVRADGSVIWVRDNGRVVKDEAAGTVTVFGAVSDISQSKYYEEVREALMADLKKVNAELADFAYIVSHDLKAPLRAISSLAVWLAEDYGDKLDGQGKDQLQLLLKRARRMHNLIEGILSYSRLGRVKPVLAEVDSHETARQVIESLAPPESVALRIEGHLPAVVYDRTHLDQLIQNLCSNAIKHLGKPQGKVVISCAEQDKFWEFCVRDDGMGIEPQHFERIFKIFQTLKPRDEVESTGIGLTIVKKTVELYGGTVRMESEPGRGAAFFFTVPKGLKPDPERESPAPRVLNQ